MDFLPLFNLLAGTLRLSVTSISWHSWLSDTLRLSAKAAPLLRFKSRKRLLLGFEALFDFAGLFNFLALFDFLSLYDILAFFEFLPGLLRSLGLGDSSNPG